MSDEWQLDACAECGYALEGLAHAGICPECGQPYDRSVVILQGIARGNHANVANGGWRAWVAMLFASAYWVFHLSSLTTRATLLTGFGPAMILLLLFQAFFLFLNLLKRLSNTRPGIVSVQMDGLGCAQVDHLIHLERSPYDVVGIWFGALFPPLFLTGWAALLIRAPDRDLRSVGFLAGAVVYLGAVLVATPRITRHCRSANRSGAPRTYPWSVVLDADISPARIGYVHLRVRQRPRRWRLDVVPVDAEVRCSPARAEQLRRMISRWIRAAGEAAATKISTPRPPLA